jgi:hypothetical protein
MKLLAMHPDEAAFIFDASHKGWVTDENSAAGAAK